MKPLKKLTAFDLKAQVYIIIVNINNMKQSRISLLFNYVIFNFISCMTLQKVIVVMGDIHHNFLNVRQIVP